jgi:hypothetical protein
MGRPDGAHTHGPQGGGGTLLAVIAAAVLIGSGAAPAAVSALVTIVIVTGCVIGLAVLGGIALLVYRARSIVRLTRKTPTRSERPGRPIPARPVYQLPPERAPQLEESHKPAIEPRPENHFPAIEPPQLHLHFHGMSPAEVAEAIRQASRE